jgi:hypothetical protein
MRSLKRYYDEKLTDEIGWDRSTQVHNEKLKVSSAYLKGRLTEMAGCRQGGC